MRKSPRIDETSKSPRHMSKSPLRMLSAKRKKTARRNNDLRYKYNSIDYNNPCFTKTIIQKSSKITSQSRMSETIDKTGG